MSQAILIHSTPKYLQVAWVEENRIWEIDMEPQQPVLRMGDIYYGKVVRILPDMRLAFIEIGSERTALLHFSDVYLSKEHGYTDAGQYLRIGQLLPVQITKLPRGEKGAVVSSQLQLIGALVIYQPLRSGVKVAKGITDVDERSRLYDIINPLAEAGVMIRSLAAGQPAEYIRHEFQALRQEWQQLQQSLQYIKKQQLLRPEHSLACTYIRERLTASTQKIYVDAELYELIKNYMSTGLPAWLKRLEKVNHKQAPWRTYKLDKIIAEAFLPKISLPSGGNIVIERTEALTVIDVNTDQAVQSLYQTNKEAARVLAQQIRLRNISGIIVVDFMRMHTVAHQEEVLSILRETLATDPVHSVVHGFSPLGLVEISRQRFRNSWTEDGRYKNV